MTVTHFRCSSKRGFHCVFLQHFLFLISEVVYVQQPIRFASQNRYIVKAGHERGSMRVLQTLQMRSRRKYRLA